MGAVVIQFFELKSDGCLINRKWTVNLETDFGHLSRGFVFPFLGLITDFYKADKFECKILVFLLLHFSKNLFDKV